MAKLAISTCGTDCWRWAQKFQRWHGAGTTLLRMVCSSDGATLRYTVVPTSAGRVQPETRCALWASSTTQTVMKKTHVGFGSFQRAGFEYRLNRAINRSIPLMQTWVVRCLCYIVSHDLKWGGVRLTSLMVTSMCSLAREFEWFPKHLQLNLTIMTAYGLLKCGLKSEVVKTFSSSLVSNNAIWD